MNNLLYYFLLLFGMCDNIFAAKDPVYALTLQTIEYCKGTNLREYVTLENFKVWSNNTSSGYIEILQDFPPKATARFQAFEQKENTWVSSPLSIDQLNLCQFIENDVWFVPVARKVLNIPERCPMKKGHLTFKSVMIFKRSIGICPYGCFKGQLSIMHEKKPLMCLDIVTKVSQYSQRYEHNCIQP